MTRQGEPDGHGDEDGFFYPEQAQGGRPGRLGRRPPSRPAQSGSRLAWLLCAFLLVLLVAGLVWVDAPLRAQLQQATLAQQQAMAAVAQLEARNSGALATSDVAPPDADPRPALAPAAAAVAADLEWAQARCRALAIALNKGQAAGQLSVELRGETVVVSLPLAGSFAQGGPVPHPLSGEAAVLWGRVSEALAKALAADETPYRLALFVPQREALEAGLPTDQPPQGHRSRRGRRRQAAAERSAQATPVAMTALQLAAGRAATLLAWLDGHLAQRPKSSLEAGFGRPSGDAPSLAIELRLHRLAG